MSDEELDQLADASARWSDEFGCEVSFNDASHGHVNVDVDDVNVGTWSTLPDAERNITRLWMIR